MKKLALCFAALLALACGAIAAPPAVMVGHSIADAFQTTYYTSKDITAAAQALTLVMPNGTAEAGFQVTGTFVATLQFEGTIDGTNWFSVKGIPIGGGTPVTSTTGTGQWRVSGSGGLFEVRVRCSAWTSGTATVTAKIGVASPSDITINGMAAAGTQGTPSADVLSVQGAGPTMTPVVVKNKQRHVDVTLNPSLAAHAAGTILGGQVTISGAASGVDLHGEIASITIVDKDHIGGAFDLVWMCTSTSLGSSDSTVSISAANLAAGGIAFSHIQSGDWTDLVNSYATTLPGPTPFFPATGTDTIYVWGIQRGTSRTALTANSIQIRIFFKDGA